MTIRISRCNRSSVWDEEKKLVKVNRTETCDATHDLISSSGLLILPRRSEEVEIFAKQCCNIAKVLQEDPETGSREYRYRKLGEDHYRHALNYFWLASRKVGVMNMDSPHIQMLKRLEEEQEQDYNPLTYGLIKGISIITFSIFWTFHPAILWVEGRSDQMKRTWPKREPQTGGRGPEEGDGEIFRDYSNFYFNFLLKSIRR